ncbi:MAG: ClbS/DfsB family four-helix bundle protein [Dehalococcoidia bacterium]
MKDAELLAIIKSERAKLNDLLDAVDLRRMEEPGVSGFYSIKDIIAHLTAYERALVNWLKEAKAGRVYVDSVLDQADLDARNAVVHEANKRRSAAEVVRIFHETFDQLEACVILLTDDELTDAELTAWFVLPRWQQKQDLWKCIANDSYEHHQQHIPDIERWLTENGSAG